MPDIPKIGLEAILMDKQFQEGLKRYIAGTIAAIESQQKMAESSEGMSKAVDKSGETLDKAGDSALDFRAKMENLQEALDGVRTIVGTGLELAELGAQFERVEDRFEAFAEDAGGATEILEGFQEGAGGAASKMEAMQSASRLLQMGLVANRDEMALTVEMATRLGDQTQSVTDRVSDFSLLLSNTSIPRLDNFGISSGKVRARIKELQAATEGLSRESAFMTAVFEEGQKSLGVLGERVDDSAMAFERAQAKMADMRVEMGQKLAPVAAGLMNIIADMETPTLAFVSGLVGVIAVAPKLISAIKAIQDVLKVSSVAMGAAGIAIIAVAFAIEKYGDFLDDVAEKQKALDDISEQLKTMSSEGAGVRDMVKLLTEQFDVFEQELKLSGSSMQGATEELIKGALEAEDFQKIIDLLHDSVLEGAVSWEDYDRVIDAYNESTKETNRQIPKLSEAYVKAFIFARDFNQGQKEVTESTIAAEKALKAQEAELLSYADKVDDATKATKEFAGLLGFNEELLDSATRALLRGEDGVLDFDIAVRKSEETLEDERDAIEAVIDALLTGEDSFLDLAFAVEQSDDAMSDAEVAARDARDAIIKLRDAQREAALAAAEHEISMGKLAERLSQTGPAAAAREAIERLDDLFREKKVDREIYREELEQIQLKYGLATERGWLLVDATTALATATADGVIAGEDYNEALEFINENTYLGEQLVGAMLDQFAQVPFYLSTATGEVYALRDSGDEANRMLNELETEALARLPEAFVAVTEEVDSWRVSLDEANFMLDELPETLTVVTEGVDSWRGGLSETNFMLDEVTVGVDSWRDGLSETNFMLDEVTVGVSNAAMGVDDFNYSVEESSSAVFTAVDDLDFLATKWDELQARAYTAGVNLVHGLAQGVYDNAGAFTGAIDYVLQKGMDYLPESEPKFAGSPLAGLGERGAMIAEILFDGFEGEAEERMDALFDAAGVFGRLGSAAARLFKKQELDPTKDALGEIEDALKRNISIRQDMLKEMESEEISKSRRHSLTLALLANETEAVQLERERMELAEKYAEQQERILKLQKQQMNLRFLEQQMKLLDLITERGLDAEEVLGGLQLGLDANLEELIDAMSRAMEEVIKQAETELGIGSASREFERIGEETMRGMERGIRRLSNLPIRASLIAARTTAAIPAAVVGGGPSFIDNSIQVNVPVQNQVGNEMDLALMESRIVRAVWRGIRREG